MKVVHTNQLSKSGRGELLAKAKDLEKNGKPDEAAKVYESIIKKNPTTEYAYDRLMIIYRKKREYKQEKAILDNGIKAFEEFYKAGRVSVKKRVATLSQALLKATGLADRKGKLTYEREPLGRWKKRRKLVESKLKN